jgi:glutamate synthase (NADPH/NADH) small chain
MSLKKNPMPTQPADVRNKNFFEVEQGFTADIAVDEANRCLNCKNMPCVAGCPVNIDIPAFISRIKESDFEGAYSKITEASSLPAVCGRVCPQESQCEGKCVRGIKGESVAIGRLERFVADNHAKSCQVCNAESNVCDVCAEDTKVTDIIGKSLKVAVVGSGPAGLTCAGELAKNGAKVTIFEALHKAGGVLIYGIPEFRLPKSVVAAEIENLKTMGVELITNAVIGKTITVDELFADGFDAVFIGSGAGLPNFMKIPGESFKGVYSANEYLTRINLMKAYDDNSDTPAKRARNVAVVGGGNVAMDAARCAKRLGAENVYIVYRRSEVEMPARVEEVHHAKEEGIIFKTLCNPVAIIGDDSKTVTGITCVEMELGEPDASGRRRPIVKEGSEFTLECDAVIMSIGTSPNPLIKDTTDGLDTNRWGCIVADDNGKTTRPHVYAGGDTVTGAATVILAMGAGKTAAQAILKEFA